MFAVQFVVPDTEEQEHHFTEFAAATQAFQQQCDRKQHGISTLWAYDTAAQEWVYQRGQYRVFDGKESVIDLQDPPGVPHPMTPAALEDLMNSTFDHSHHFGPDH